MRILSRHLPRNGATDTKLSVAAMIFLATVFAAIVYWICVDTTKALVILGIFIVLITVTSLIHLRKISKLRISRCDTICDFRKSFNPREVDPWIIRATYEGFTHLIDPKIPHFPLRATDLIEKDLGVDPDDIYDLLSEIADRAGYDLSECESNPYFGKIKTIADFVHFISHQPKKQEAQQAAS